jgi:hypothetical protein
MVNLLNGIRNAPLNDQFKIDIIILLVVIAIKVLWEIWQ